MAKNPWKYCKFPLICFVMFILLTVCSGGAIAKSEYPKKPKGMPNIKHDVWHPYMTDVQETIKANWNPPRGDKSKRVSLLFKVGKNGELISSSVFQSSGSKEIDDAALEALNKTAPFKPLPKGFPGNSVDIQFTFDYNVFGPNGKEL